MARNLLVQDSCHKVSFNKTLFSQKSAQNLRNSQNFHAQIFLIFAFVLFVKIGE